MKDKWSNYALKDGKVQKSYIREYSNRSPKREARETSCRHSLFESRESQEEVEFVYREGIQRPDINPMILEDTFVIDLRSNHESIREENPSEAHQEGQQRVQEPTKRRSRTKKTDSKVQDNQEIGDHELHSDEGRSSGNGCSQGQLMALQDFPEAQVKRRRKTTGSKKPNPGP